MSSIHDGDEPLELQAATAAAQLEAAAARMAALVAAGAIEEVAVAARPALVVGLLRAADRAQAAAVHVAGVVHRSGHLPDGHTSTTRWLQNAAGLSRAEASAVIARGGALESDFAPTGQAWLAGEVTGGMVRAITTGVATAMLQVPVESRAARRAEAESLMLAHAQRYGVEDVARIVSHLRVVLDPDGARQAALDAYDDQHLVFTPVGAGVAVKGWLAHETAALITTALERSVDLLHRSGQLASEHRADGDDAQSRRARRLHHPHLCALALAQICGDAVASGALGRHHAQLPRVTVTVGLDQLAAGLGGELLLPGRDDPAVLVPASIRRMLCDSEVTAAVVAECGTGLESVFRAASREVLYVGREHRVVPPRLRRALELRDHHCAFPGCRVNVARCRAHHVQHWESGGCTALDNCVLLCERHHHRVHEGGWSVSRVGAPESTGCWRFAPPPRPGRP